MLENESNSIEEHPKPGTLKKFAVGQLDGPEFESISTHIESCQQCLSHVTRYINEPGRAADTFLADLREFSSGDDSFTLSSQDSADGDSMQKAIERQGRYRILETLGSGGMGTVYLAEHRVMDRKVAIKVIRREYVASQEAILRFQNEVRNAAKLSHRNIVTAHDAEQADGIHFLVMEYVEGESLAQLVKRKGALPLRHSCNFILQAAHGLRHAHKQQMVHRDIKPGNIMRTPRGVIKILDFGLARINDNNETASLTTTGIMMGTADYVAPEQARDARIADVRSDLYSLGCTLYFLLVGRPPFPVATKVDKVMAHCAEPFPDVSELRPEVPDALRQIIGRLTEKRPEKRYQTPGELIDDLTQVDKSLSRGTSSATLAATSPTQRPVQNEKKGGSQKQLHNETIQVSKRPREPNEKNPHTSLPTRRIAILAMVVTLFAILFWIGSGYFKSDKGNGGNANNGEIASNSLTEKPEVLLVLSARNFWFADYEPIVRVLAEEGVSVRVTADRAGMAQFNPAELDPSPNRHPVEILQSIVQLDDEEIGEKVDAIVFIGTSTREFRTSGRVGSSVNRILDSLQKRKKWIASVGKGSEVPIHFGFYDGVRVSDSHYIEADLRQNDSVNFVEQAIVKDSGARVLTASIWDDAENFARELALILNNDNADKSQGD